MENLRVPTHSEPVIHRRTMRSGFTMVEMIIVLSILATMTSIGTISLKSSTISDRLIRTEKNELIVAEMVRDYVIANNSIPTIEQLTSYYGSIPECPLSYFNSHAAWYIKQENPLTLYVYDTSSGEPGYPMNFLSTNDNPEIPIPSLNLIPYVQAHDLGQITDTDPPYSAVPYYHGSATGNPDADKPEPSCVTDVLAVLEHPSE